jgi:hypothetical protein
MVWCSLDLEDYVPTEPAATLLARQIVDYAAKAPLSPAGRKAVVIGLPDKQVELMDLLGLEYQEAKEFPAQPGLAVIGSESKLSEAELKDWLQKGGKALFLTPTEPVLGVTFRTQKETRPNQTVEIEEWHRRRHQIEGYKPSPLAGKDVPPPNWPETRGLSVADLHRRGPLDSPVVDQGADIGSAGLLGRKVVGQGVAVFCMVSPEMLNADKRIYLRLTRWRQTRLIGQLLSNMGGTLRLDGALPRLERPGDARPGYYHPDYKTDHHYGDNPYRFWRW